MNDTNARSIAKRAALGGAAGPSKAPRAPRGFARPLSLLLVLLLLPLSARAQSAPTLFVAGEAPPVPPLFAQEEAAARPALAQAVDVCTQQLADTAVALDTTISSPWAELRPTGTPRSQLSRNDFSHSAPRALFLDEARASVTSLGQQFTISASPSEVYGSLWYRYESGRTRAGDRLQVEIYQVGQVSGGSPIVAIDAFDPAAAAAQADGTWRQFSWSVTDAAALAALGSLGQAQFLITMRSTSGNSSTQLLWIDDIDLNVCTPSSTLSGTVTAAGAAAAGAQVLLARTAASGSAIIANTTTDAAGAYSFVGVPPLASGSSYQVWFLNAPTGAARPDGRLGFWAGPTVASLPAGTSRGGLNMAVGDVALGGPPSYSAAVATDSSPVTLSWSGRGIAGETYQLCVYDPQRGDRATGLPPQVCGPRSTATQFSLSPRSFSAVPGFEFRYGRSYRWYVVAYGPGGQYGHSFYERAITLVSAASPPPSAAVTPSATPPAAAGSTADWLLMVYAAGDNALGDPARTPDLSLLDAQLGQLRRLAGSYPRLHLVTLSDSYGSTGAQLCYLRPAGAPSCQERGEINTGDPATLGEFVKSALARYPAARKMLVIAGPGHAIGGIAPDLTAAGAPAIDLAGLRGAFVAAGLGGGAQLDVVFYAAPLMGSIEVAAATGPYARYMVAAPDEYWSVPLYSRLLPLLAGAKKDQPAEVAKGLVAAYGAALGGYGGGLARSLAAYDLARAPAARAALNGLGSALGASLTGDSATVRAALGEILQDVQSYDSSGNGLIDALIIGPASSLRVQEDGLVDLGRIASAIGAEATMPPEVREAAGALQEAVKPLVLLSDATPGTGIAGQPITFGSSLSISAFFPVGARLGGQPAMAQRYLYGAAGEPRDGAWAGFLRAYLSTIVGVGPGGVTAGPQGGAQFRPPAGGTISLDRWLPLVMR